MRRGECQQDGDDAKSYQEHDVRKALAIVQRAKERKR